MTKKLSIKLGFIILIIAYSLSFLLGYLLMPYMPSQSLTDYLTSPLFILIQSTFSVSLLLLTFLIAGRQKWRARDFGFGAERRTVAYGAALGLGMFLIERVSYHFLHDYIGESQLQRALVEAAKSEQGLVVMLLVGAILAPLSEEVYFRGYMLSALAKRFGEKAGVVLSSAYFAVVHLDARAFFPIFVLGAILAFAYLRTRSLTLVITAHMVINSTTFLLSYIGMEI
jgi:membrane protease YdiL (CAAX protease family)